MAREVVVSYQGNVSRFGMSKVDRTKLYKRRRRIQLGPDGEPCRSAKLAADGSLLVLSGMTAQGYFTENGSWVPSKELVGLDAEGEPIEKIDSTLGVEQALEGPVDAADVLDLKVQSVYGLDPSELDDALKAALEKGEVFRFSFNYRADYQAEIAFLIANNEGEVFALIGQPTVPVWQDVRAILPAVVDDDEDDDELDFEMF